jgi:hypothetical protein
MIQNLALMPCEVATDRSVVISLAHLLHLRRYFYRALGLFQMGQRGHRVAPQWGENPTCTS